YRLWITAASLAAWTNRPMLSEEPLDGTFVYGNQRVIYNVGCHYAPNPFVQSFNSPTGSLCNYSLIMPTDDRLLGATAISELHVPGNLPADEPPRQCEQTACWMAGQLSLPAS